MIWDSDKTNNPSIKDNELLKNGILIRSCQSYRNMPPDCYRIAVKKHTDNEILIDFISDILTKCII